MIRTKITDMLGIVHPVIQGGMAWISDHNLAAAVSNAGGLGVIAAGNAPVDAVRKEIEELCKKTDKPFGVNIMLMSPYAEDVAKLVTEMRVPVVITGAGNPQKYIPMFKEVGIKIIPVVPNVNLARRLESYDVDAVIAEGCEAGGHIGEMTTMALVPQVVSAINIPVIAAGGIADGRGLMAAFALGAQGVQMGTVFVASKECTVHQNYKDLLIKAKDTDTIVTGRIAGFAARQLKNKFSRSMIDLEKKVQDVAVLEEHLTGSLRKAAVDGNVKEGSFMAGQIAGMVKEERSAKQIVDYIIADAEDLYKNFSKRSGVKFE